MRNLSFFVVYFLLLTSQVFAQKKYRVVYNYNIKHNIAGLYKEMEEKGITVNDRDNITSLEEERYRDKLRTETIKRIYNRRSLSEVCTPLGQFSEVILREKDNRDLPDNVISYERARNKAFNVLYYKEALDMYVNIKNGISDTTFRRLDTAAMVLKFTGLEKDIAGRKCREYVPAIDFYKGITFWADEKLPEYIFPAHWFGLGIKGGIAAVTFDDIDLTITLESISEIKQDIPPIAYPKKEVVEVYNPVANRFTDL